MHRSKVTSKKNSSFTTLCPSHIAAHGRARQANTKCQLAALVLGGHRRDNNGGNACTWSLRLGHHVETETITTKPKQRGGNIYKLSTAIASMGFPSFWNYVDVGRSSTSSYDTAMPHSRNVMRSCDITVSRDIWVSLRHGATWRHSVTWRHTKARCHVTVDLNDCVTLRADWRWFLLIRCKIRKRKLHKYKQGLIRRRSCHGECIVGSRSTAHFFCYVGFVAAFVAILKLVGPTLGYSLGSLCLQYYEDPRCEFMYVKILTSIAHSRSDALNLRSCRVLWRQPTLNPTPAEI